MKITLTVRGWGGGGVGGGGQVNEDDINSAGGSRDHGARAMKGWEKG